MMFSSPDTVIPDPYNPLDWNRYLYGRANPVNGVDPSGHKALDCPINDCENPKASGSLIPTSGKDNKDDDLVTFFDENLSKEDVQDILSELDFWLERGENLDDVYKVLEFFGVSAEVLTAMGFVVPEVGVPAGVALFVGGIGSDYTVSDLSDLRYAIAMSSKGGTEGISLSLNSNVGSWNVKVNHEKAIKENYLPGPLMILSPKGVFNGTPTWLMTWYLLDYSHGPFYPGTYR